MSTASEEILARYKKHEIEVDAFERQITVRRLRPSEQVALMRMADTEMSQAISAMTVAASVLKIDDDLLSFPRSIAELNGVMDRLDEEGLAAATAAYVRMQTGAQSKDEGDAKDTAKNLQATAT